MGKPQNSRHLLVGLLQFFGNPGDDSFFVFPDWDIGTTCSITEVQLNESGVEVDDSECDGLPAFHLITLNG